MTLKIGLFGWYQRRNYGDDLMAAIFANEFDRLGWSTTAWRLYDSISGRAPGPG
jgi:hypothetical protein